MLSRSFILGQILFLLCLTQTLNLARAEQQNVTHGFCSPIFVGDGKSTYASFRCTNYLGTTVVYKLDDTNTKFLAHYLDVDSQAVLNLIGQINNEHVAPDQLVPRLIKLTEEVKYLREQFSSYTNVIEVQGQVLEAQKALDVFDIEKAKLILVAMRKKFTEISQQQHSLENLLNIARTDMQLGRLEMSTYDYDNAFDHIKAALEELPGKFESEITELRLDLAQAALAGVKHYDQAERLVTEAQFYSAPTKLTDTTVFLRGVALRLNLLVDKKDYKAVMAEFKKNVWPLISGKADHSLLSYKAISLCIVCVANAANGLERYRESFEITSFYIEQLGKMGEPNPPDLVPTLIHRANSLLGMKKGAEALVDLERAKTLLEKYSPDGLNPSYPDLWLSILIAEDDQKIAKDAAKQTIVSSVLIFQDDYVSMDDYIHNAIGLGNAIMCVHAAKKGTAETEETITEPVELAVFDPKNCDSSSYASLSAGPWSASDVSDIKKGITESYSRIFEDPKEVINSALLTVCTQMIFSGWQAEGRDLCKDQIQTTINNSYASPATAEATFRLAQLSYQGGYDFGIDDQILYVFSKDAFTKLEGPLSQHTQDATYNLAQYLKRNQKAPELEFLVKSQSELVRSSEDKVAIALWKKNLKMLATVKSSPTIAKRSSYASVVSQ